MNLGFVDGEDRALVGQMLYYARRAGYLEGAMSIIAIGATGVDPQVAARRALDAVGSDILADNKPDEPVTKRRSARKRAEDL